METIKINIDEFKALLFNAAKNNAKKDLNTLLNTLHGIKTDLFSESYMLFDTKNRLECITEIHFEPLNQHLSDINSAIETNKNNREEISILISAANRVLNQYK